MQDFVKEPVLGLLKSVEDLAPEELMHGMARGAGSLLNHSVGGVANSVSLITGGKGKENGVGFCGRNAVGFFARRLTSVFSPSKMSGRQKMISTYNSGGEVLDFMRNIFPHRM